MINIKIMCVGKIKDKNLLSLINEYQKRISKYAKLEIIDVEMKKFYLLYLVWIWKILKKKKVTK